MRSTQLSPPLESDRGMGGLWVVRRWVECSQMETERNMRTTEERCMGLRRIKRHFHQRLYPTDIYSEI